MQYVIKQIIFFPKHLWPHGFRQNSFFSHVWPQAAQRRHELTQLHQQQRCRPLQPFLGEVRSRSRAGTQASQIPFTAVTAACCVSLLHSHGHCRLLEAAPAQRAAVYVDTTGLSLAKRQLNLISDKNCLLKDLQGQSGGCGLLSCFFP